MAANTTIEWATKSWNPVRGCSRVSPGCDNCYAMGQAHRFSGLSKKTGKPLPYHGLTTIRKGKVDWSGVARFIPSELDTPLGWREPQRIFVNSMSDLFHHSLTDEQINAVFGVMAACERHQFLILTKRAERMFKWFSQNRDHATDCGEAASRARGEGGWSSLSFGAGGPWPLPNVWLGVSVENQETADERIPLLLQCPAAVRWVSCEPLLDETQLWAFMRGETRDRCLGILGGDPSTPGLDWVVVGGESGPGARPFNIAWAREIVRLCRVAGVSVFVKQLGSNVRDRNDAGFDGQDDDAWDIEGDLDRVEHDVDGYREEYQGAPVRIHLKARKGGDMAEWPEDLRVREFPA